MKRLLLIAATIMASISCQKLQEQATPQSVLPLDAVMRFSPQVSSRAGATTDNTTSVGVFVTNPASSDYSYKNIELTKGENGWETQDKILWRSEDDEVTITAYAPYDAYNDLNQSSANLILFTTPLDQSSEETFNSADVLLAESKVTPSSPDTSNEIYYDSSSKSVNIDFQHLFSLFTLKVKFNDEFSSFASNPITKVEIRGAAAEPVIYSIDESELVSIIDVNHNDNIFTPLDNEDYSQTNSTASYSLILPPQTRNSGSFWITLTIDGATYKWTSSEIIEFVRASTHTLTLNVGGKSVVEGDITVSEWGEGGSTTDSMQEYLYSVGDVYPVGATGSDVMGIVYQVGEDGASGRAISVDERSKCAWYTLSTVSGVTSFNNYGLATMKELWAQYTDESTFSSTLPGFYWAHEKNVALYGNTFDISSYDDVSEKNVWFIPSQEEITPLITNFNTINEALAQGGYTQISDTYWSAKISSSTHAYYWSESGMSGETNYLYFSSMHKFRAVLNF